jgi:hypothetical protein
MRSYCKKVLIGALSKTISFLLSYIVQQKSEAATSNYLFEGMEKAIRVE